MKQKDSGTEPSQVGPALARFARRLGDDGYPNSTRKQYLSICHKFNDYLSRQNVALAHVRNEHVDAFLVEGTAGRNLREGGRLTRRFWRSPVTLLVEQLRAEGIMAATDGPAEVLGPGLAGYLAFLREHRGLSKRTVQRHKLQVTRLLAHLGIGDDRDLGHITVEQIDRYLVEASHGRARQSMGAVCSSTRGFLAYLHMRGALRVGIHAHVATPRLYTLEDIPRAVAWSHIERTLGTIDRSTNIGCRDYAMLALVAYCGLRAGEVAVLRLEHIDWRHDTIHAPRPKAGVTEDVPLIRPVGEALLAYLRRRSAVPHSEVFLTVDAPIRPVPGWQISKRAQLYLRRADVKVARPGAHTLRHSLAVELLRRGNSLKTIGDVLGQATAAGHVHGPQQRAIHTPLPDRYGRVAPRGVRTV